jgi:hypothetical protein
MLSYIGLIGFEFTVIEMNKNNLKRGESLTYTIGETLTCTIGESLTPFEVQSETFLERMLSVYDVPLG